MESTTMVRGAARRRSRAARSHRRSRFGDDGSKFRTSTGYPISQYLQNRYGEILTEGTAEHRARLEREGCVLWSVPHPETGKPLIELTLGESGPHLYLYDHEGKVRVELCACPKGMGAAVDLYGDSGNPIIGLWDAGARDGGALHVSDGQGHAKAFLIANAHPHSAVLEIMRLEQDGDPEVRGPAKGVSFSVDAEGGLVTKTLSEADQSGGATWLSRWVGPRSR